MATIQITAAGSTNTARPFSAHVNGNPLVTPRGTLRTFATETAAKRAAAKFAAGIKTDMPELARIVIDTYGVGLFQRFDSPQGNLAGRSHYLDASAFKTRIVSENVSCMGLVFWIIESSKTSDTTRGFCGVAFDVFGNEIVNTDRYSSADHARKAFWAEFNAVNVAEHYKNKMRADVERMRKTADKISAAILTINA